MVQIVCYKGSPISYAIAKRLVQVKYISLVNLILDKEIVKELIQKELNTPNIAQELKIILNKKNRIKIKNNYKLLKDKLGRSGASKRLAKLVVEELTK